MRSELAFEYLRVKVGTIFAEFAECVLPGVACWLQSKVDIVNLAPLRSMIPAVLPLRGFINQLQHINVVRAQSLQRLDV